MNSKRFNHLVETRIEKIRNVLASKAAEYSKDYNKLHNFDKAGRMAGTTREIALKGFLLKHLVSVDDIIEGISQGKLPTKEAVDEKLGDIINYYILLEACLIDRIEAMEGTSKNTARDYPLTKDECYRSPAIHHGVTGQEKDYSSLEGLKEMVYQLKTNRRKYTYKIKEIIIEDKKERGVLLQVQETGQEIFVTNENFKSLYEWKEGN